MELTTTDAARYLAERGVTVQYKRGRSSGPPKPDTIKRWLMTGKLKGRKVNPRLWLISQEELERFLGEKKA